jgi:hypothetical protein
MPCYSPLKGFKNLENGGIVFKRSSIAGEAMEVACGQCLGCRLDRSRQWGFRIMHEASQHDDNCFITLTYDDEHMPRLFNNGPGTLNKKDFQDFMKRLRKRFHPRKIRYYHCGEYGENYDRPHYHACIFGLDFDDKEVFTQNADYYTYTSDVLSETWGLGFVTVGELTLESAMYTARYVLKKVNGHNAPDHYLRVDDYGVCYWLEPEYTTMSRRPGIGKNWYEKFKGDVFPSDEVPVVGQGVLRGVPRYYETILKSEDPDTHDQVKKLRQAFKSAHEDEYTPSRLMQKYKVKKAQVNQLKRTIE